MQGDAGTCYIKAAMGSLAEFPQMVRDTFVNTSLNSVGIINVRFYIRGKPWIVTIDNSLLVRQAESLEALNEGLNADEDPYTKLVFAQPSVDGKSIWGALLEKAWAKVRGNYLEADQGGYTPNGLRVLTGYPVFEIWTSELKATTLDAAWAKIKSADDNGYIMAASTDGEGDD